jgi:hypothetical protein
MTASRCTIAVANYDVLWNMGARVYVSEAQAVYVHLNPAEVYSRFIRKVGTFLQESKA